MINLVFFGARLAKSEPIDDQNVSREFVGGTTRLGRSTKVWHVQVALGLVVSLLARPGVDDN